MIDPINSLDYSFLLRENSSKRGEKIISRQRNTSLRVIIVRIHPKMTGRINVLKIRFAQWLRRSNTIGYSTSKTGEANSREIGKSDRLWSVVLYHDRRFHFLFDFIPVTGILDTRNRCTYLKNSCVSRWDVRLKTHLTVNVSLNSIESLNEFGARNHEISPI